MYRLLIYCNDKEMEVFKLGHIAHFFSLLIRFSFRFVTKECCQIVIQLEIRINANISL